MSRNILRTSRWYLSALAALALLPATSQAKHRLDHMVLLPAARSLHHRVQTFEAIACQRPIPRQEQHYIRLMTRKACRLVDGIQDCAPHGRIKADYNVLNSFMRVVDRRLDRHCARRQDYPLRDSWSNVQSEFGGVGCLLNGCSTGCTLHPHGLGSPVPEILPPRKQFVPPAENLLPPTPPQPAVRYETSRDGYSDPLGRFARDRRSAWDPNSRAAYGESFRPDRESQYGVRSAQAAPVWLDLLIAALSR